MVSRALLKALQLPRARFNNSKNYSIAGCGMSTSTPLGPGTLAAGGHGLNPLASPHALYQRPALQRAAGGHELPQRQQQQVATWRGLSTVAMATPTEAAGAPTAAAPPTASGTHLCTSLTAPSVEGMLVEAQEAVENGATIVELRIDYLQDFSPDPDLRELLEGCPLPAIVTYRPDWEG